jgi:hypothetical protein
LSLPLAFAFACDGQNDVLDRLRERDMMADFEMRLASAGRRGCVPRWGTSARARRGDGEASCCGSRWTNPEVLQLLSTDTQRAAIMVMFGERIIGVPKRSLGTSTNLFNRLGFHLAVAASVLCARAW